MEAGKLGPRRQPHHEVATVARQPPEPGTLRPQHEGHAAGEIGAVQPIARILIVTNAPEAGSLELLKRAGVVDEMNMWHKLEGAGGGHDQYAGLGRRLAHGQVPGCSTS